MLSAFFLLALGSSWNDSAIFDETAHIGAGYSYLTRKDMRLNPEHPPLVKDLAALPLIFLDLNFPTDTKGWQEVNGQWDQGGSFLFEFGNNPDTILRLSRFPIILLAVVLGILLFSWTRRLYGNGAALLTLFFYAFSPTIIAHSRFVTTDMAAAFGFFMSITTFTRFLRKPSTKNLILAGLVFGIAESLKFSLVLLMPIFGLVTFAWLWARDKSIFSKSAFKLYAKIFCILILGLAIIWIIYAWHIWHYPQVKQLGDVSELIGGFRAPLFAKLDLWLISHKLTRPLGQYLFGLLMVTQRTAGGNTAYFLGEVSSEGWWYYFPVVYLLKESLAFHLLTLLALVLGIRRVVRAQEKSLRALCTWTYQNLESFAGITFIIIYWASSIANPLNIGVRHVLPTFPFIYLLVSRQLVAWTGRTMDFHISTLGDWFRIFYYSLIAPIPKIFLLFLILIWILAGTLFHFPYYLSYYNELAGADNGYRFATDSNYDWGQDLKRLAFLAKENPKEKIYLDYFGGSSPHNGAQRYYLGEQFVPWYSSFGPPPAGSLFAVSINSLQGNQALHDPEVSIKEEDTYPWLLGKTPIRRAGSSIFLYRIP